MVSFNDEFHIEQNIEILRKLNQNCDFRFIILNNSRKPLKIKGLLDKDLQVEGPQRKNLGGVGVCELGKRSLQNNATRIAAAGIKGNT
jgi:hypothetical protein